MDSGSLTGQSQREREWQWIVPALGPGKWWLWVSVENSAHGVLLTIDELRDQAERHLRAVGHE